MLPSYDAAFPNLLQSKISKGDHHHEQEENGQTGTQHGSAAARADRLNRRAECGELLCQPPSLAQVIGGQVRQEAGAVLALAAGK